MSEWGPAHTAADAEHEVFLVAMTHDLADQVTTIRLTAQIARRRVGRFFPPGDARLAAYLQMLDTATGNLATLLDTLLDVERSPEGHRTHRATG